MRWFALLGFACVLTGCAVDEVVEKEEPASVDTRTEKEKKADFAASLNKALQEAAAKPPSEEDSPQIKAFREVAKGQEGRDPR